MSVKALVTSTGVIATLSVPLWSVTVPTVVGASFRPVTVTVMVAVEVPPLPSLMT